MPAPLLSIRNLSLEFTTYLGRAKVLQDQDLDILPGEILGLVGETGCGKSVTARCILRLIPTPPGRITSGSIHYQGQDLLQLPMRQMRRIRGNRISMIFQEPMSCLNPVFTVGAQMTEVLRLHERLSQHQARQRCAELLAQVQMPDPERVLRKYPHELSGGMRQRVMIAMELSCNPELLLADEPTTALDVTVQGQVLQIIKEQAARRNLSVLLITHDMGVVAQVCHRVAVMYAGMLAECAPVRELFAAPQHPYTQGLIAAIPGAPRSAACGTTPQPPGRLASIPGTVPGLIAPPKGCRFHTRCAQRFGPCTETPPPLLAVSPRHDVACHLYAEGRACP